MWRWRLLGSLGNLGGRKGGREGECGREGEREGGSEGEWGREGGREGVNRVNVSISVRDTHNRWILNFFDILEKDCILLLQYFPASKNTK